MYGLSEIDLEQIVSVFSDFPVVDKAILYGSRAKGSYRDGSDIDITLVGNNLDLTTLLRPETLLDDLLLPYTIDLSIFHKIENLDLIHHINRVGIIIYERATPN